MSKNTLFLTISGIIVIFCISIYAYTVACGLLFTYDSFEYLASANSFYKNGSFLRVDGTLNTIWTPLFAILLSFFKDHLNFYTYVQGAFLIATLGITFYLGTKVIKSTVLIIAFAVFLCVGVPIYMVHAFLWSEPFFVFLISAILLVWHRQIQKPESINLIIMVGLSFLLCLQRNAGIFFVVGMAISMTIHAKSIWFPSIYTFFSSIGWIVWTVRNFILSRQHFHPAIEEYSQWEILHKENVVEYLSDTSSWLLPPQIYLAIRILLILGFLICISLAVYKSNLPILTTLYICTLVYWVFMQFIEDKQMDEVQRYNAVVFPIFSILAFFVFDQWWASFSRYPKILLGVGIGLVLAYSSLRLFKNITQWHDNACASTKYSLVILTKNPQ